MPKVTQPTERPGLFKDKLRIMVSQEKKRRGTRFIKLYGSEEKYRIICMESLRISAEDKIEFSLNGALRKKKHVKMGLDEYEFSDLWRAKMKIRLQKDGFIFELTDAENLILEKFKEEIVDKKKEELSEAASVAMKKIIESV